jgi:hypothetical protein
VWEYTDRPREHPLDASTSGSRCTERCRAPMGQSVSDPLRRVFTHVSQ